MAYYYSTNCICCVYVRVRAIDISVAMVAQDVLVGPGIHGGTVEEILRQSINCLPNPRLVRDAKMAAKEQ